MADEASSIGDPEIAPGPPPVGRRLWERFSLSVLAFLLLLLGQESFGILVRDYSATFSVSVGPLIAYLAFAILAGLAAGMAVVLPMRLAVRHPRRGITLALVPLVVTALNVTIAVAPEFLPDGIGGFAAMYLIGLQSAASLAIGIAAASVTAES